METHRIKKLAESIDALAGRDESLRHRAGEIATIRRQAAQELYRVCSLLVKQVNALTEHAALALSPDEAEADSFPESGGHSVCIETQGRKLEIRFEATAQLVSTEDFRVPYTISGTIDFANLAEPEAVLPEEQLLFYCLEKGGPMWRYFDPRTYRSGPFNQDYLVSLLEQLL